MRITNSSSLRTSFFVRRFFWVHAWLCSVAIAQVDTVSLDVLVPLDFGTLAVSRNDLSYSLTLSATGIYGFSQGILLVTPGQPARYRVKGLPANTTVTLELFPGFLSRPGNVGPYLTIKDGSWPKTLASDQQGEVVLQLGASIATDGNGVGYPDGSYAGAFTLRLNYPTSAMLTYRDFELDASVQLMNTLTIVEQQELQFGKISAWAANTGSARMTLSPSGEVILSDSGGARILSYGSATPGIYQVTGGAPFTPVKLSLPVAEVALTAVNGFTAARLFVGDFKVRPADDLVLDGNGQLEFRLGATLRTEQTAAPVNAGNYKGTFSLLIEYP